MNETDWNEYRKKKNAGIGKCEVKWIRTGILI